MDEINCDIENVEKPDLPLNETVSVARTTWQDQEGTADVCFGCSKIRARGFPS